MFTGHNPQLVALSVAIAILGGYTGFGLAARVRGTRRSRRMLLAGAAGLLAVSIWTMHFVGMLAAPIPPDAVYLILPTVVSFLLCALVVGVSLFFVSIGPDSAPRIAASALLLGLGIVSMHYVGVHGLAGDFSVVHDNRFVLLAGAIAVGAGYGGLRIFLARHGGTRLILSAVAFGIAVSGMHYTAMLGMRFVPGGHGQHRTMDMGPAASPQVLALVVALLCFLIVASFLLFLVPEPRSAGLSTAPAAPFDGADGDGIGAPERPLAGRQALPLGGLGQPRAPRAGKVPVEVPEGTQFVDAAEIRSIRANAHYTFIHDGVRERLSPWSISQAETALDPEIFLRVHRSHIVAVAHVTLIRKEGDGAVVELGGPVPHLVPVSRAKIAEVKARLGLLRQDPEAHSLSR
ncbi:MHYT domain-containing protein [Bosea sp. (in: a-proteobacteria)]